MSRSEPIPSGNEELNLEVLRGVLEGPGIDLEILHPRGGRPSLVARIEGAKADADSLALMGHTDVVPAEAEGWTHDPFGGELVDGEVWGRGAVDMLNQTTAMALALRELADSGFRPRGSLIFLAVPDEECGGRFGMKPLVEQYRDSVVADYVLTEVGGAVGRSSSGRPLIEAYVAEKGMMTVRIVARGVPGHTSVPWGADNAIVRAAEVIRRLDEYRPPADISREWRHWVDAQEFDESTRSSLLDPMHLWDILPGLDEGLARTAHACCHRTVVPAIIKGGEKMGTIPDSVDIRVHVRHGVDDDPDSVLDDLRALLAGLVEAADVQVLSAVSGSRSQPDTPLWSVLERVASGRHPGARLVPSLLPAQTDARWLRPVGVTVYGFGVLSEHVSKYEYWQRFHGRDERIDVASLDASLQGWIDVCGQFLSS